MLFDTTFLVDFQREALRGTPLGDNGLWIAATALEIDTALVTRDRRRFDRIPNLRLLTY